jgi:hypothetical protein
MTALRTIVTAQASGKAGSETTQSRIAPAEETTQVPNRPYGELTRGETPTNVQEWIAQAFPAGLIRINAQGTIGAARSAFT